MVYIKQRKIKGKVYLYLEKSVRLGYKVKKLSRYLGSKERLSKKDIDAALHNFKKEILDEELKFRIKELSKQVKKFEYPITLEEVKKIEEMNLKYREIMKNLNKKSVEDLNKRFIANYVFESNALEGNSLTLKNVAEIVFENRISAGKDLREIYDAQNSYKTFISLQRTRNEINHKFIMGLHSDIMEGIDDRTGYRKEPVFLTGKTTKLAEPEEVHKKMSALLKWYEDNNEKIYPLELAFKFHAGFEKIHPFSDGNGRVGRFLLNYILMRKGYFPVIIRKTSRNRYIRGLEAADREKWTVLMRFALDSYKKTFRNFFEIYYKHAGKSNPYNKNDFKNLWG
ncbi:MAG: Fic family protein [Candidatus Woesearchaeota archaeon]